MMKNKFIYIQMNRFLSRQKSDKNLDKQSDKIIVQFQLNFIMMFVFQ